MNVRKLDEDKGTDESKLAGTTVKMVEPSGCVVACVPFRSSKRFMDATSSVSGFMLEQVDGRKLSKMEL